MKFQVKTRRTIGVVKGFRIGTRILYKLEDIEESMKSIETRRYSRGY